MITIALLAFNKIKYTRMCLDSVLAYTPEPCKLLLIDNGSTDGTLDYFKEVDHKNKEIIHYDENEVVEEISNRYLEKEENDYLIGVTNDTIVHAGWSENLIACLTSADDIGMVGPRSNCISGPQQVYPGVYDNLDEYQRVADQWARDHKGEYFETNRIVGMLAAIKMKAYRDAGGYDVTLPTNGKDGGYGYSDDDMSRRMTKAGYRLLITNDVFIHHFGSVTVSMSGLSINRKKYERIAA